MVPNAFDDSHSVLCRFRLYVFWWALPMRPLLPRPLSYQSIRSAQYASCLIPEKRTQILTKIVRESSLYKCLFWILPLSKILNARSNYTFYTPQLLPQMIELQSDIGNTIAPFIKLHMFHSILLILRKHLPLKFRKILKE